VLLELTEVLACPRCGPPQGLVALVSDVRERRIVRGELGCPACDARFPIRDGVLEMVRERGVGGEGHAEEREPGGGDPPWPEDPDLALRLAALLGREGGGVVLLEEGSRDVADEVARLLTGTEVIALRTSAAASGEAAAAPVHSRMVVAHDASRPLLDGRVRGVALLGGAADRLREAARVLGSGGRLVVLLPDDGVAAALAELGFEVLAADPGCLLAARTPGR